MTRATRTQTTSDPRFSRKNFPPPRGGGKFLLDTKENPRLCRGDTKAYGVEESKKEKVSKLE